MAVNILYDKDARDALGKGIDKLADAVVCTLGPKGRNVAFDQKYDVPLVTNDGVTIAKSIELEDIFENLGAGFLKQAAMKANDTAGDGTTAAVLLGREILREGIKNVVAGANPIILRRGIEEASKVAISEVMRIAKPVEDSALVRQIAMISGNNDAYVGDLVCEAFEKVGLEGIVTVEDSQLPETSMKFSNGIRIEHGYSSEHFITNKNNKTCELVNPYILLYDGEIKKFNDLMHILEQCINEQASLLIISSDVTDEALQGLALNVARGVVKAAAVKTEGYGDTRRRNLRALCSTLGGQVVTSEVGLKLSEVGLEVCGRADRVVIDKETCVIQNPMNANSKESREMYYQIKDRLKTEKADYEIERLNTTLALLNGSIVVITVGGTSELEMFERKYRIEDAVCAVHAAVDGGIVPGGGKALILAIDKVNELIETLDGDEKTGAVILRNSLTAPIKQIAFNAGLDPAVVADKLILSADPNFGFNALTLEYGDMIEMGIIDPAKVITTSLEAAVSVASTILTSDAAVADPKGPKDVNSKS